MRRKQQRHQRSATGAKIASNHGGRRARTIEEVVGIVQRKFRSPRHGSGPDIDELLSRTVQLMSEGDTIGTVAEKLTGIFSEETGWTFNREDPYDLLRYAAYTRRFRYVPTTDAALSDRLEEKFHGHTRAHVVLASALPHVAAHGAKVLLQILQEHAHHHPDKSEIHVGFAEGGMLRLLAKELAALLWDVTLPKLVFHAMVGGFDVKKRSGSPNTFATYLVDERTGFKFDTEFVGLHAPAIVSKEQLRALRGIDGIKSSFDEASKIDVAVTSAGRWDCHSLLKSMLDDEEREALQQQGCAGDLLWSPFGREGAIEFPGKQVSMRLVDLQQLETEFVRSGKRVLLILGPCGQCGELKSDVLSALINSGRRYVTDLVVDAGCAREVRF